MQALLDDIELDIQELKCVMEALSREPNKALREVAKRNIMQMRGRLDTMLQELDIVQHHQHHPETQLQLRSALLSMAKDSETMIVSPDVPIVKVEVEVEKPVAILAEQIKHISDLRCSISLNDSFRFSRELFGGDSERMNAVLQRMGDMNSFGEAIAYLSSETGACDDENEAMIDLLELLKKFFN